MRSEPNFRDASIVAPLTVPFVLISLDLIPTLPGGFWDLPLISLITAMSYVGLFLVGLPAACLLKSTGRLSILSLCLGGTVGGVVYFLTFVFVPPELWEFGQSAIGLTLVSAIFGGFGAMVATTFWLVAGVKFCLERRKIHLTNC